MLFIKFSLFFLSFSAFAFGSTLSEECLNANYETTVSHKGQPFGLTEIKLTLEKQGCLIVVKHERYKFLKKEWLIDVCRAPVHIKSGAGAVNVLRRNGICEEMSVLPFCVETEVIEKTIEDDGLIFAVGDKDTLSDDHGKVSCVARLLDLYLNYGQVMSRGERLPSPMNSGSPSIPSSDFMQPTEPTIPAVMDEGQQPTFEN